MLVEESTDYELIKTIITNPVLFRLTYGQGMIVDHFEVDPTCRYLIIKDNNNLVGCFQVKELTKLVLDVHIFILPLYWGKGLAQEAVKVGHDWVKSEGYLKTFTRVPANCTHVLKFLEDIKYRCCGMIEKGIIHNKVLVSLFFYEFEV